MVQPLICWFKRWIITPAVRLPELSMVSRILDKNVLTFCDDGLVKTLPQRWRRTFCPKKSKPSSTCVIWVFSCEPSFLQELGHERLDLITEKCLRRACDQEVIRIAYQVDFGLPLSLRRVREVFRQQPL